MILYAAARASRLRAAAAAAVATPSRSLSRATRSAQARLVAERPSRADSAMVKRFNEILLDFKTTFRKQQVRARVCAGAIRVAEKWLKPTVDEAVLTRLAALAKRPEPAVRLQLALSLGEAKTPAADAAARALLLRFRDGLAVDTLLLRKDV